VFFWLGWAQVGGPLAGFNTTLDDGVDLVQEAKYQDFFTGVEVYVGPYMQPTL
jgi:hypothetical protein